MLRAGLKRALFALPAESAHNLTINALRSASLSQYICAAMQKATRVGSANANYALKKSVMGIDFPNPVGLAAGFDKNAVAGNALRALGFGWVEFGTVTPRPQSGNPKPRIFRLPAQSAVINRLGLNSVGAKCFVKNITRVDADIIKGINIGKNTTTKDNGALDDYLNCLSVVYEHADYVAINISCPNIPQASRFSDPEVVDKLLGALDKRRGELAYQYQRRVPLVIKISPDLDAATITALANLARKHRLDGIAATNTTTAREMLHDHHYISEAGGLSGAPLHARALNTVQNLARNLQGEIPIIGCGGIDSSARAVEMLQAGAELVQIYTGFIYQGPKLIQDILLRLQTNA